MIKEYEYKFNWEPKNMDNCESDVIANLTVHYSGLSENEHEIELAALATSWQGLAKVLSSAGELAAYGRLFDKDRSKIKVTTSATIKPGSIIVDVAVKLIEHPLFVGCFSAIFATILNYLLTNKNNKDIEKLKSEILKLEIENEFKSQEIKLKDDEIQRLKNTANDLAASVAKYEKFNRKYCRELLSPIGEHCELISCFMDEMNLFNADIEIKEQFRKETHFIDSQELLINIRKLDKKNGSCTVLIIRDDGNDELVSASIKDGRFSCPTNEYLDTFANRKNIGGLKVIAQEELNEEDKIVKLNIFSIVEYK